ncbi:hypothetical protein [Enterovibrio norvegicus]|uniref:hypothetical protein n=1 Tax=Enterovibrio norvegicus TaxID=188144 RepID=UPI0024B03F9D|nr:hypothetical protein [Enterovibrio norvegicus]
MSRLDTRGFMDGALRAYDIVDRKLSRDEDREIRKQQLEKSNQRADQQMALRMADEERRTQAHEYQYGVDGEGGALRQAQAQNEKLFDANLAAAHSRKNLSDYQLSQQRKSVFINENAPLLQTGWQHWMQGGDIDDIFNHETIKGGAYDPRRYLDPDFDKAANTLETALPMLAKGKGDINAPEVKSALNTFYKSNLQASVGATDPKTEKTIQDARWGEVTFAKDINPELEGDQPGLVLTAEVNYGGEEWVPKPITERRSTDADDHVKIIPLEQAMQDITGQLKMRRQAMVSPGYKALFEGKEATKQKAAIEKEYRQAYLDLEKQRNDALTNQVTPTEESTAQINAQINAQHQDLKALYGLGPQPSEKHEKPFTLWANGDPNKQAFLAALQEKYGDLDAYDEQTIAAAYKDQVNDAKAENAAKIAGQIRVDKAKQYASR